MGKADAVCAWPLVVIRPRSLAYLGGPPGGAAGGGLGNRVFDFLVITLLFQFQTSITSSNHSRELRVLYLFIRTVFIIVF